MVMEWEWKSNSHTMKFSNLKQLLNQNYCAATSAMREIE